jgi:hypothetical protein
MHRGSILRIDVIGDRRPYAVPADNPFVDSPNARPEIWMYGLRNPWRFSFDERARQVIVPDVGWNAWEEINLASIVAPGANFGWPHAEGNECVAWDPADCAGDKLTWPAVEYHHVVATPAGCSIIGGTVYRGARSPEWHGVYVFGDFCSGEVWAIRDLHRPNRRIRKLLSAEINPSAIGEGPNGEIYFTDALRGSLSKIDLPDDFEAGWENLAALHNEAVTTTRRSADVALLHFLDSRVDPYSSPHIAIRKSPAVARVFAWYDAIGRPSIWLILVAASVAAVIGLALLAGFVWMALRLRSLSRGRVGAEQV